jgi:hypothetical protein
MFLTGLIHHLVKTPQTRLGHRTISASPEGKAAFSDAPTDCCGCLGFRVKTRERRPYYNRNPRDSNSCCGTSIGGNFNCSLFGWVHLHGIRVVLGLSHSNLNSAVVQRTHAYYYEHTSTAEGLEATNGIRDDCKITKVWAQPGKKRLRRKGSPFRVTPDRLAAKGPSGGLWAIRNVGV